MNKAIRDHIVATYQPWRRSPAASMNRGRIGDPGAFPIHDDTRKYFESSGITITGRYVEDLLEDDLLAVYDRVRSWLSPDDRATLDKRVAFGAAQTHEPNAYAMPYLDGYAILFNDAFDTLLISAMELYCGLLLEPQFVTAEQFPLALNTAIAATFFHVAHYSTPIPDDHFPHRAIVNSNIWLTTVFFVAHEIGHVLLNHLEDAEEREAVASGLSGREPVTVLKPLHEHEYEADRFALDLIFRADERGDLVKPGADRAAVWNSTYTTIGWVFALLEAIEELSDRLKIPEGDTHPPAAFRWERLAVPMFDRQPVSHQVVEFERKMHDIAASAARSGPLPEIRRELAQGPFVAFPWYSFTSELTRGARTKEAIVAQYPPIDVFMAWINAGSTDEAKALLKAHPELATAQAEMMHYDLADKQAAPMARGHILHKRLPLVLRARETGIDEAFAEFAAGQLPVPPEPVLAFDVPPEDFQLLHAAREANDEQRVAAALAASPRLAAFDALPQTLIAWVGTTRWQDTQRLLEEHPELLHPATDGLLDILADGEADTVRARVESFRSIVHRAREVGAARAVLEARIVWNVTDEAPA